MDEILHDFHECNENLRQCNETIHACNERADEILTCLTELQRDNEALRSVLEQFTPKPYWSEASKSLVMRLRGIYAIGPNADQMAPNDKPEFGWRTFLDRPAIQFEAAQRIEELEEEIKELEKELQKYVTTN